MAQHIVAIGGGGLEDTTMLQYVLDLSGKERPKICFLPQASAEDKGYVAGFYDTFTKLGAEPSWQSLYGSVPQSWQEHILAQDIIYVGGGNTKSMLALWRDWGMDRVLKRALENGTILSGVSAGAICWFEECVTDSVSPLGWIEGLGWLKGSACPHYDGEAERRPTVQRMIKEGEIIAAIALDNNSAAHYIDGEFHKVITTKSAAQAYQVVLIEGEANESAIDVEFIGV
jgi:dipeptidase E